MKWTKKGLIYAPNGKFSWNKSHAQIPLVEVLGDDVLRIYYSTRNKENNSYTTFIDVDANNPANVLYMHDKPILDLGELGTFDDSGIMPSSIVNYDNKKYLFYTGWNVGLNISYRLAIGLAISEDNGKTFNKFSNGPILDRSIHDNCLCASPFVLLEDGIWKMWYISGTRWENICGKMEPFYHIKYSYSLDGFNWVREGKVCIDYDEFTEGISRPCVIKERDKYMMYYSFRNNTSYRTDKNNSYRIGAAISDNGLLWTRIDEEVGIRTSLEDWDSNMIAYPYVIAWNNKKYMFYNGNGFGKTGFGYAVLDGV